MKNRTKFFSKAGMGIFFLLLASNTFAAQRTKGSIKTSHESIGKTENVSLSANFILEGNSVSGDINEANVMGMESSLMFQHQTSKDLELKARAGAKLEEGSSESIFPSTAGASFKPKSIIILDYAEANYKPLSWLNIQAGAINQGYHQNPLLLTRNPFAGIKENIKLNRGDYQLSFSFLQSIPSNHTLSQRLGRVQEGSTRFYSERAEIEVDNHSYESELGVGHFAYDQLSPSIAYNSRLLGNTVDGLGAENNSFKYNYIGWNSNAKFLYKGLGKNLFGAYGSYHINTAAPAGQNVGFTVGAQYGRDISLGRINLFVETFENQSDSAVAYYTDKTYGFVNRQGLKAKIVFRNFRDKYQVEAEAVRTSPIRESYLQDDESIISISLRKRYDIL